LSKSDFTDFTDRLIDFTGGLQPNASYLFKCFYFRSNLNEAVRICQI